MTSSFPARESVLLSLLVIACCGGENAWEGPVAATLGEQEVLTNKAYRELPLFETANVEYGERVSQQCQKCHSLAAGDPHRDGPNLAGFFGRRAASLDDFEYSKAFLAENFVWTPRALDAWLAAPDQFLPGNAMDFDGVPNPSARIALIAYLLSATDTD